MVTHREGRRDAQGVHGLEQRERGGDEDGHDRPNLTLVKKAAAARRAEDTCDRAVDVLCV